MTNRAWALGDSEVSKCPNTSNKQFGASLDWGSSQTGFLYTESGERRTLTLIVCSHGAARHTLGMFPRGPCVEDLVPVCLYWEEMEPFRRQRLMG